MIITTRSGHQLTESELNKMATLHREPWRYSSYLPVANPSVAITTGQLNKLLLPTTTVGVPDGFDLYTTPQGNALRFIGSGLGNGDSASFTYDSAFSSQAVGLGAELTYSAVTRPYTEVDFQAATLILGTAIKRTATNNSSAAVPVVAPPIVTLNDGDLIEFSVETAANTNFILNSFTFEMREIQIV